MCVHGGRKHLSQRLEQARRLVTATDDPLSKDRIQGLISDLEGRLAEIEKRDTEASSARDENHPPPEEDFGGGDICSPEQQFSTDDDKPLD